MSDRNILKEIHRRSVWQVVSVYVASAWGVVGVVDFFTDQAGLPDWTPTMALVLLLIGLPIVLATAIVQGGVRQQARKWPEEERDAETFGAGADPASTPGAAPASPTDPSGLATTLTWKNARRGALVAAGIFVLAVGGYLLSWATGIGPVGNLVAQGVIERGDPVLLADFENTTDDEDLGRIVTEALRVDLSTSEQIEVVDRSQIENILELMTVDGGTALRGEIAEEVAIRGGIKAIVEGSIGDAGSGFILVAAVRESATGETVATFRRTASSESELLGAIDALSQDIRERSGESLTAIRADAPLEAVTTASLPALRVYSNARREAESGRPLRALELAREAVDLDPEFAMAHRLIAVLLGNLGIEPEARVAAATRAHELRDRLTDRERLLAQAYWNQHANLDPVGAMRAYESVLERYPEDPTTLNNLAILYADFGRLEESIEMLERAVRGPGATSTAWTNLPLQLLGIGRAERAREVQAEARARYPDQTSRIHGTEHLIAAYLGEWDRASAALDSMRRMPDLSPGGRELTQARQALVDAARGRVVDARTTLERMRAEARSGGVSVQAWEIAQALFAVDMIYAPERLPDRITETVQRELIDDAGFPGPEIFTMTEFAHEFGRDADAARAMGELEERLGDTPIGAFIEPVRTVMEISIATSPDPDAAEIVLAIGSRLGCPDCFPRVRARAALRLGQPDRAADLYDQPGAIYFPQWLKPFTRREAMLRLAEAAEAAGDSARAVEALRRAIRDVDQPDAEARAWLNAIEARITALGG